MSIEEMERVRRRLYESAWRDRLSDHVFEIVPTASADPELAWAAKNGGPVCPTLQWHRTAFYDSPDDL
jgi:hypothetical protein